MSKHTKRSQGAEPMPTPTQEPKDVTIVATVTLSAARARNLNARREELQREIPRLRALAEKATLELAQVEADLQREWLDVQRRVLG